MKKKQYIKPSAEVVLLQHQVLLLAGSVDTVTSSGLDDQEILEIITNTPESGDNAW